MTKVEVDKLIADHSRLIEAEASKYFSQLPAAAVKLEAYKLAYQAAKTFDTSKDIKFSTYLTNALKKLSRMATQYGGTVRIPENKQFYIQKMNTHEKDLEATLGRPPTAAELSQASGFSIPTLLDLKKNKPKLANVTTMFSAPVFVDSPEMDDWIHFVYHDLNPIDKSIFEYKTGFCGKPLLENDAIAKKLNLPINTVNSKVREFSRKLAEGVNK